MLLVEIDNKKEKNIKTTPNIQRNKKMEKIINKILKKFNIRMIKHFPKHSTRFAKKYFKNKPITVIEIGTWKGENAKSLLENLNIKKIYLIDPYEKYSDFKREGISRAEKEARKKLKPYSKKIKSIKKYSRDAIKDIPESVDFVYIDGNHKHDYVLDDMKKYFSKIKEKGILAGHDIDHRDDDCGVARAFIKFCHEFKQKPFISRRDWWIIKNEKTDKKPKK